MLFLKCLMCMILWSNIASAPIPPSYIGELTSSSVHWENNQFPPTIGPSHQDALAAIKTILLQTSKKMWEKNDVEPETRPPVALKRPIEESDKDDCWIGQEKEKETKSGWIGKEEKLKATKDFFHQHYPFTFRLGDA